MQQILIINGPNLHKLGSREPEIYGTQSFEAYLEVLKKQFSAVKFEYKQSNIEGEIINYLYESEGFQGIIINPGAYAHTSIAIADAIKSTQIPVIEVHISNVFDREPYRHTLYSAANCAGVIIGFGLKGYALAVQALLTK